MIFERLSALKKSDEVDFDFDVYVCSAWPDFIDDSQQTSERDVTFSYPTILPRKEMKS